MILIKKIHLKFYYINKLKIKELIFMIRGFYA